jgi:hypothetical protein
MFTSAAVDVQMNFTGTCESYIFVNTSWYIFQLITKIKTMQLKVKPEDC